MDPLTLILSQLGLNIASNAIYDLLKLRLGAGQQVDKQSLVKEISSLLNVKNAEIKAETIISFLAKNGNIKIEGSQIVAGKSVSMFSKKGTELSFRNGSSSETPKTRIDVGDDAEIKAENGAGWRQNEDGSISFFV